MAEEWTLRAEDVREFARRDRHAIERLKRRHWADVYRQSGPSATLRIGHALYEHARRVLPGYPDAAQREADLRDHVALKDKLDRTARVVTVR